MSKERIEEGEKHYTSTVFIITKKTPRRVLLVHHKKFDRWMPPGGHQEVDENPHESAIRETQEETGIDIRPYLSKPKSIDGRAVSLPLPNFLLEEQIDAHKEQPSHYHLDMIYIVSVPYQKVARQEGESHSIGWFTREECVSLNTFENVQILLRSILSE